MKRSFSAKCGSARELAPHAQLMSGRRSRQESPYLFSEVHRLATALKEVEEVREEVQEIKDEWEDQEDEENGGLKVEEKRSSHAWMR